MSAEYVASVCPHDCPSACALEVERLAPDRIGKVRGAADHPYTAGVVCAKVSRYAERVHHAGRIAGPLRRTGAKGGGDFEPISWDDALDDLAEAFVRAARRDGAEAVWPYYYAGTMGLLQRDGILRLQRLGGYSVMGKTICSTIGRNGWAAGVGSMWGVDPTEIGEAEVIVMWGTNAVATQIQAMNQATDARKARGARIVTVDPYRTRTAAMSDMHLAVRPGTDGALACAVMHVLFREGMADRDYMARHTDCPERLEAHLASRGPEWASAITGLAPEEIVAFARLYGSTRRSYIRLGVGFSRQRNGAANVHAVSCLPAVTGAWTARGGGALYMTGGLFSLDMGLIHGTDVPASAPTARTLDMSRIGAVLEGDADALAGGPPVAAMLVQNTNPAVVAPESARVRRGLAREDLFLCVHEQFMTDTARLADLVLPATTFVEHDDLYTSYGQGWLQVGRRIIEPFAEARSNHDVLRGLAGRLGLRHPAFEMGAWEVIDATLRASGFGSADEVHAARWIDCRAPFDKAHFIDGFGHADGRFRFAPDWAALGAGHAAMPALPDHAPLIEAADADHPFRLVTAPARNFLNSSFTECPTSVKAEKRPGALLHPEDCAALGIGEGARLRLSNRRGAVFVHARPFDGLQRGVVVVEGIWPNGAFEGGAGINTLVGSDSVAPGGGAAFHDTAVAIEVA